MHRKKDKMNQKHLPFQGDSYKGIYKGYGYPRMNSWMARTHSIDFWETFVGRLSEHICDILSFQNLCQGLYVWAN